MRAGLRLRLIDQVEAIQERDALGAVSTALSRVLEPGAPRPDTKKPYIVVQDAGEDTGEQWADAVQTAAIFPVVDMASFARDLDPLVTDVNRALDHARFTDGSDQLYAVKRSESADSHDERFDGILRRIVYEVWRLNALVPPEDPSDPVTAMRDWLVATFPQVQVDPLTWQPTADAPGVFWRLESEPRIVEQWPSWALMEVRVRGHVLSPSPTTRTAWARKLAERLAVARRLTLTEGIGEEARSYPMDVIQVAMDPGAHPMRTGQVAATMQYGVRVPEPVPAPVPLTTITVTGLFEEATL